MDQNMFIITKDDNATLHKASYMHKKLSSFFEKIPIYCRHFVNIAHFACYTYMVIACYPMSSIS